MKTSAHAATTEVSTVARSILYGDTNNAGKDDCRWQRNLLCSLVSSVVDTPIVIIVLWIVCMCVLVLLSIALIVSQAGIF